MYEPALVLLLWLVLLKLPSDLLYEPAFVLLLRLLLLVLPVRLNELLIVAFALVPFVLLLLVVELSLPVLLPLPPPQAQHISFEEKSLSS